MIDWGFWIAAGGITLMVVLLMLSALRSRRGTEPAAAHDLQVYRDQLREVERDLARGVIGAEEAKRLRAEVGRRVLEADRAAGAADAAGSAPRWATGAVAVAILVVGLGALLLYDRMGAPGYPDLPMSDRLAASRKAMETRPLQATLEAQAQMPAEPKVDKAYLDLMEKLRKAVKERPDDLRGQQLLAQNEARLGRFAAAWRAQAEVVRLEGAKATAEDYAWQAELMVLAAGGAVSREAEAPLARAMRIDPKNGTARFFTGLLYEQVGRPDLTFQLWEPLLKQGPADAPWIAPIREQIEAVAQAAGIRYSLPPAGPALKGPTAGDVAAASQMSAGDRQQMIRGMVEQLSTRLEDKGGSPAEWAQLITAYGVLGETDKAKAAWEKAKAAYGSDPEKLAPAKAAAEKIGVGG